jgi:hypothetical protein
MIFDIMGQLVPSKKCQAAYNYVLQLINYNDNVFCCASSMNQNKSALKGKAKGRKLKSLAARCQGTGSALDSAFHGTEIFKNEVR